MKRTIAAGFVGALIFAGSAPAATPTQRISALEKQVKTLNATVKKQTKQIKNLNALANASFTVDLCLLGATADALQSTWTTIDQALGTTVFGPQQTISDLSSCSDLRITRQGIKSPPTVSVFSAIVALFKPTRTSAFSLFDWWR